MVHIEEIKAALMASRLGRVERQSENRLGVCMLRAVLRQDWDQSQLSWMEASFTHLPRRALLQRRRLFFKFSTMTPRFRARYGTSVVVTRPKDRPTAPIEL